MSKSLRIGELALRTGVKVVTVRYYERMGLMPDVKRTVGNYRLYGEDACKRLAFIRRCRDLGFTLDQVRDLLRLCSDRDLPCAEVKRIAIEHQNEIAAKLNDLRLLLSELRRISRSCRGACLIAHCQIVEALDKG